VSEWANHGVPRSRGLTVAARTLPQHRFQPRMRAAQLVDDGRPVKYSRLRSISQSAASGEVAEVADLIGEFHQLLA
jgi:hypothetical protein